MIPIEKIPMPNGLTVEVWDKSVSIAEDTTKVALLIRIPVELRPSYFARPDHYELVRKIMGPEVLFEYKKERPFVRDRDKNVVFQEHFLRASLSSNTVISRKTATNTIPFSVTTLPDSPDGTSPTLAKSFFEKETKLYNLTKSCNHN
jgi:hypothetical protein